MQKQGHKVGSRTSCHDTAAVRSCEGKGLATFEPQVPTTVPQYSADAQMHNVNGNKASLPEPGSSVPLLKSLGSSDRL